MTRRFFTPAALLAAGLAFFARAEPVRAESAASAWSTTQHAQVRLVSAVTAAGADGTVPLGLHFRMEKGWKIYWRSPGDAGFPPKVKWDGSENLARADLSWPIPERFRVLGIDTVGYKDEVVLPLAVRPARTDAPLALNATVDFLTCDQICVPYTTRVSLSLPAGPARPSAEAHLVNRFAARVPSDGQRLGLSIEKAEVLPAKNAKGRPAAALAVTLSGRTPLTNPDVFIDGPADGNLVGVNYGPPQATRTGDGVRAVVVMPVDGATDAELAGRTITVAAVADGGRIAERTMTLAAGTLPAPAAPGGGMTLSLAILTALLGGLILNLMPCVLPVLSIKLLGVVKHGGGERRTVRLSFIASAAGILFSFLLLAGALIALKAGGAAIGWGIQFQQPWFLIAMILVVMAFAANLWGFFEVHLPQSVADLWEHAAHVHGLGGHFLTGMFATLLATPCTAPFLGTAVGFALARGPAEILSIFAALGVGLALPYLAVAAWPGLATRLPRPGPWMARLKQVLGLALLATAVWLATVLAAQIGVQAAFAVALLAGLLVALLSRWRHPSGSVRLAAWTGIAAVVALAFFAPSVAPTPDADQLAKTRPANDPRWRTFDEAAIPGLIAAGKTVFVDVTADWCITCKANKAVVLNQGEVAAWLASDAVVAMQADWTRPDDRIAAYLARFGRYGIPFNIVYGQQAPAGIPLPEILTEKEVMAAARRAGTAETALSN
ncbi:MAG: hypothetical protein FJX42_07190 [Alphaproteobacteria bacterium]|nr:hypothetical protein [Alphaproteobacteria bacterium]